MDARKRDGMKIGRTGLYRVRKGWFGRCILQYQSCGLRSDAEGGGHEFTWHDEGFDKVPAFLATGLTSDVQKAILTWVEIHKENQL